ncbi:hypothetical protein [Chitinolyticbacter meiyuanensis]|uniref:hypothetical protein n=1 Tax=Chitinolyticbacter meiyuanensis TaxID=682798 RepID=UPI0011E58936|nr:hypothetical protein [Chitinolyticbacter meiyuanensis]
MAATAVIRLLVLLLGLNCAGAAEPGLRDPMRLPAVPVARVASGPAAAPTPAPKLTLVRIRAGQRTAWINNRPYQIGDQLDDARIVAIDLKGVTLQRGSSQQRLPLQDTRYVQPVGTLKRPPLPSPATKTTP